VNNDPNLPSEVATWLSKILHEKVDPTNLDANLIDVYGADSMDMVDMVEMVERKYGLTVTNDQIFKIRTFGDLLLLIGES